MITYRLAVDEITGKPLNSVYEIPEYGTGVSKQAELIKGHTLQRGLG